MATGRSHEAVAGFKGEDDAVPGERCETSPASSLLRSVPRPPRPSPPLSPTIVASDGALSEAIDELLRSDPVWRRDSAAVRQAQERLRTVCTDEGWLAYLKVESATNERFADALDVVARWAFGEGRRWG
jgi:hypothetical protein